MKRVEQKDDAKSKREHAATEANLKKIRAELQEAVAAGKLTKEQTNATMTAIKKAKLGEE